MGITGPAREGRPVATFGTMPLRWDPLLVRALAGELHDRLAGSHLRAIRLDGATRDVVLLFREATLAWPLHPDRGAPLLLPPTEPAASDLGLASRVRQVRAPVDERILVFELLPSRGRGARDLVIELLGNQWNAVVTEGADARVRHVLVRREGRRPIRVGDAYRPPPPSDREGAEAPLSAARWREILESGSSSRPRPDPGPAGRMDVHGERRGAGGRWRRPGSRARTGLRGLAGDGPRGRPPAAVPARHGRGAAALPLAAPGARSPRYGHPPGRLPPVGGAWAAGSGRGRRRRSAPPTRAGLRARASGGRGGASSHADAGRARRPRGPGGAPGSGRPVAGPFPGRTRRGLGRWHCRISRERPCASSSTPPSPCSRTRRRSTTGRRAPNGPPGGSPDCYARPATKRPPWKS